MKLAYEPCYSDITEFVLETQALKINKVFELVNITICQTYALNVHF